MCVLCVLIRGVAVGVSCTEQFTGKFQMEVIIPVPLKWGLWSEQGMCVSLCSGLEWSVISSLSSAVMFP